MAGKRKNHQQKKPVEKEIEDNEIKEVEDTASFAPQTSGPKEYELREDWEQWVNQAEDEEETEFVDYDNYEPEEVDEEASAEEDEDELLKSTPKRNDVVLCQNCGEDYSKTYRRCPFCDERSGTVKKKRPVQSHGPGGMDPRHFAGFSISMLLIFSAGFIVLQEVMPLLMNQNGSEGSSTVDKDNTVPSPSVDTDEPGPDVVPEEEWEANLGDENLETPEGEVPGESDDLMNLPQEEAEESPAPSPEPLPEATSTITLSKSDVSLSADESFTLTVPSGGTVTWTSSHPEIASVNENGRVTNLNTSGSKKVVEIYGTVDGARGTCVVRCASGTSTSTSDTSGSSTNSSVTTGAALITNAGSGVRIRGGASTDHPVLATGYNGSDITVVGDAGDGWYEITFIGNSGKETGYVRGEYIEMK